jgi:solute carrier family 25 carnitine/acylcarnitine transporter 20/29
MSEAVAKDLAAGTMAGVAQLLVGHPFDTIKVKLQSQPIPPPGQPPKFAGAMDAVRKTLEAEGPKGLYKGMGAPLATVAVFNAVLFTARGQMETLLRDAPGSPLSVSQQMVAGAGAGIAVSFVACPTELVKCRLQAQSALAGATVAAAAAAPAPTLAGVGVAATGGTATALAVAAVTEGAAAPATLAGVGVAGGTTSAATFKAAAIPAAIQYNGPLDVARHVLRSEGGMLGLFKGLTPTLLREVPGNAAMFGAYEATKQYIAGGTYYPNLHPNSSSFFLSPAKNWDSFQQKKASGSDASLLLHSNKEITSNNLVEP